MDLFENWMKTIGILLSNILVYNFKKGYMFIDLLKAIFLEFNECQVKYLGLNVNLSQGKIT